MSDSWIGNARPYDHRSQIVWIVFCSRCCAFTCLLLPSFSGIWPGMNGCGEIPTACNVVIPFYWPFLPVNYFKDDSFLSCIV